MTPKFRISIFTTLFIAMAFCSSAQVMNSSYVPIPQMENIFRNDVVKTATSRLFQINSPYKDSADIPAIFKDSIARVMYAVYNMPASRLRDTIVNLFAFQDYSTSNGLTASYERDSLHIHNNRDALTAFSIKEIYMSVPDSTTWAQQWLSGNLSNTLNFNINSLVLLYDISITNTITSNSYIQFYIKANRAINTYGLSKAFNIIIGQQTLTYAAKPRSYPFDKNSIQLQYQQDGITITYSNNCGDCFAGCTYGRQWSFKVYYSNCSVQYLGATNFGDGTNPYNPNTPVSPAPVARCCRLLSAALPATCRAAMLPLAGRCSHS